MVRKILCPTDFSEAAKNGIGYAAKVAQLFYAELILLNVRPKTTPLLNTFKQYETLLEHSDQALKEICNEVSQAYKISCAEDVQLSDQSIEVAIKNQTGPETLIVLGSNGSDTLFQTVFGSHAYNIIETSSSPVWIVPENIEYGSIQNMVVLAQTQDDLFWEPLKQIIEHYHPNITSLELPKKADNETSEDGFQIKKQLPMGTIVNYRYIGPGIESKKILAEINQINADIFVIGYKKKRSVFERDIVKSLIRHPQIPVLVIPY